jgi:hypothetical protein
LCPVQLVDILALEIIQWNQLKIHHRKRSLLG